MTHKDPEQRRAYERARYHKRKQEWMRQAREDRKKNPSSVTHLLRKRPGKAQRKISNPEKYVDSILTWLEKKGVE